MKIVFLHLDKESENALLSRELRVRGIKWSLRQKSWEALYGRIARKSNIYKLSQKSRQN